MDLSATAASEIEAPARPSLAACCYSAREDRWCRSRTRVLYSAGSLTDVGLRADKRCRSASERAVPPACAPIRLCGKVLGKRVLLGGASFSIAADSLATSRTRRGSPDLRCKVSAPALGRTPLREALPPGCYKVILNGFDDRVGLLERLGYHATTTAALLTAERTDGSGLLS